MFGANWHVKKTQSDCVPIRIRRREPVGLSGVCVQPEVLKSWILISSILNRVFRANVYVCCWFC